MNVAQPDFLLDAVQPSATSRTITGWIDAGSRGKPVMRCMRCGARRGTTFAGCCAPWCAWGIRAFYCAYSRPWCLPSGRRSARQKTLGCKAFNIAVSPIERSDQFCRANCLSARAVHRQSADDQHRAYQAFHRRRAQTTTVCAARATKLHELVRWGCLATSHGMQRRNARHAEAVRLRRTRGPSALVRHKEFRIPGLRQRRRPARGCTSF
jgi:hypothetical protein